MPEGIDIALSTAVLGRGAAEHDAVRAAAEALAGGLAGVVIDAAALGDVPGVPEFAAAALRARDAQAVGAAQEGARRGELIDQVRTAAALGEQMVAQTTAEATSVPVDRHGG